MLRVFLVLILVASVAGCAGAASTRSWVKEDADFRPYKVVEVRPVIDETGESYEIDVATRLTKLLQEGLLEKGFAVSEKPSPEAQALIVRSRLLTYKPGSAFARWIAPGAGKTECTLQSSLIDKDTEEPLADIVSSPYVGGGGLYTLGAEERILTTCANGIIEKVATLLRGEP